MKKKGAMLVLLAMAASTLACSFTVQVPEVKTGPDTTTTIDEAYPATVDTAELIVKIGGGSLKISDGDSKLVEGQILTNVPLWKPQVERSDEKITISQSGDDNSLSIPSGKIKNDWDLKLGTLKPLSLKIEGGAYNSNITLGNVPLSNLSIEDGAAQSKVVFSQPNKQTMDEFTYHTGASKVDLINLANANFKEMTFESGAGSYTLDFNGELKQDATVVIKSGLSNMKVIVPSGTDATITLTGGVNNVSLKGTWTVDSDEYKTQSTKGPKLSIEIEMGVGNLELISQNNNSL